MESRTCPHCHGTGQVDEPFDPVRCDKPGKVTCPQCGGSGQVPDDRR